MPNIYRLYVEKKPGFDIEAQYLLKELRDYLGLTHLTGLRLLHRYDVGGLNNEEFKGTVWTVFAEANVDHVFLESLPEVDEKQSKNSYGNGTSVGSKTSAESLGVPRVLAVEYLPGQYDQRADSAAQCVQILTQGVRPQVRTARVLLLSGELDDTDVVKISEYYINPIESRVADLAKPVDLDLAVPDPDDVPVVAGFTQWPPQELEGYRKSEGLAMSAADVLFCQKYFLEEEGRDPTLTELKVIDTYWSDHCRHTTFLTELTAVEIEPGPLSGGLREALEAYFQLRQEAYEEDDDDANTNDNAAHAISLMDMALVVQKVMKKRGELPDLDESEEINACSIIMPVDVDGRSEPWLIQFKNETHNHPTEIEPVGGAATCLGGAIRDPLSGRAYVYQAMRVTGSADPRTPLDKTLPGKLPQHKITTQAARGYSSYGNQIGLATGQVVELYHPGYVAKRMEIGAVIGAVPQSQVRRETPLPGDVVVLLGGRTGRDGCGGATGSSKAHDESSLQECGAEVQKGDPPTERKIQRLFRDSTVSRLIKKCNDFGAGGVCVAIGELARGLDINLDAVLRKYQGLDGTELAVSESQERMAVVLDAADVAAFIAKAGQENLEATPVARVNADGRLTMSWRGKSIVDLSRNFLETNGARQQASAVLASPDPAQNYRRCVPPVCRGKSLGQAWKENLQRLEVAAQQGLVDMFDSTVGAGSVLMPSGGHWQMTPEEAMVAKIPLEKGETDMATIMAYGFIPGLSAWSPCHGAAYAVVEALAKITSVGGNPWKARLSLQEYFERLGTDKKRWGKPTAALLGALLAQRELGVPAIGGKDSMSGSFGSLDVPPTLVCFAAAPTRSSRTVSAAFQQGGHVLYYWPLPVDRATEFPDWPQVRYMLTTIHRWSREGKITAASVIREGGLAAALSRMALGNRIGAVLDGSAFDRMASSRYMSSGPRTADGDPSDRGLSLEEILFAPQVGSMILEAKGELAMANEQCIESNDNEDDFTSGVHCYKLGVTQDRPFFDFANTEQISASTPGFSDGPISFGPLSLEELAECWLQPLEKVFPTGRREAGNRENGKTSIEARNKQGKITEASAQLLDMPSLNIPFFISREAYAPVAVAQGAHPRVLIPAFPGTNGEMDMARAFERAGAEADIVVVRNLTGEHIEQSIRDLEKAMQQAQIVAFPGGFSGGDEPEGAGKFIAALFRHERLRECLARFLDDRDGLVIGVCNGFQALIKLGLLPGGRVIDIDGMHPTLTFNSIGHHMSRMAYTRVSSVKSPWMRFCEVGQRHTIPVSHGEGRFVASPQSLEELVRRGQIVAQYVNKEGQPTLEAPDNPNGSDLAVEALCSPDGRILGKMGHSERTGPGLGINVPGNQDQRLFEAGVSYFY